MSQNSNRPPALLVNRVESRVEQLIADHKRATLQVSELTQQCQTLLKQRRELQERIQQLSQVAAQLELRNTMLNSDESSTSNKRRATRYLNSLIKEVDSCIAMLVAPTE